MYRAVLLSVDHAMNWQVAQSVPCLRGWDRLQQPPVTPCGDEALENQWMDCQGYHNWFWATTDAYAIFHGNLSKNNPMSQKWTAVGRQTCLDCHFSKASTIQRPKVATLVVTVVTAVEQVDSKIIGHCENLRVKTNWGRTFQISVRAGGSQELSW